MQIETENYPYPAHYHEKSPTKIPNVFYWIIYITLQLFVCFARLTTPKGKILQHSS